MTTAIVTNVHSATSSISSLFKLAYASYALTSYLVGVAGLALLTFTMADVLPLGGVLPIGQSGAVSASINILLLTLFGLQHSVMARPAFKKWLTRYIPKALERSTFVWTSGVALAITVLCWQPIEGMIWSSTGLVNYVLWGGFIFGWAYLLAATFAINHWDLFGLRQAWLAIANREEKPVAFKEHWMYRYSRHPIMLGAILGVWLLPTMSVNQFFMAVGLSLYIAIGLYFEERDLIAQWGERYCDYRRRVGSLFTLPKF